MATPELAPELAPIVPKAEAAAGGSGHDSDHAADAPCTPCQKPSKEPAPTPVPKKKYSNSDMLAIYNGMQLPQLTARPCWSTDPSEIDGVWSGASCFAAKEDVLANLGTVRPLLVKKPPTDHTAIPRFPQHTMPGMSLEIPANVIDPNWTLAQKAAALAACHAYQAATLAAASLRPIQTRTTYSSQRSSYGPQPTTLFNRPRDHYNQSRMPPFQQAGGTSSNMQPGFGPSVARPAGQSTNSGMSARADSMPDSANPDSFGRSNSMRDSNKPSSFVRTNSTATTTEASCAQKAPVIGPGRNMWEQGISKLLCLQADASSSWLVQFPHITGTMGPIPAEDMEKWLLHGVPPKQMGRAIHRPVLEATSADPASLLVCALLPGELERNMKPGQNAFVPLRQLVYGLSMGLDYSCVTKGLVDNRRPGCMSTQAKQRQSDTCVSADQAPQPDTPTTPSSKDSKDYLGRQECSAQLLVSRLQHMPADQIAGMTAAADEIASRAHENTKDRAALVREGAVGALVRVLQLPAASTDADQAHTVCLTAVCWALHCLLGRTKQAPHGCSHAQAALAAAGATKHLTKVVLAAWQADGGTSKDNESPAGSPVSELQFGPSPRLQKAAAVVLAGVATTPEGKQAILQEGSISCIMRLLGSLCAEVSAAALSVVRNLSTPEDDQIHKTLFKLGVFNMLVHVVARHKDPAVKQNALRVLLDLASAALPSPSTSPVKPAGPSSSNTAAAGASSDKAKSDKANEYTAGNAVDRLVKRGLPAVLLKLLHKDAPVALQTRAIMVLQLMAVHKPLVVLGSIKDLVEYEQVAEGQEEQKVPYNGVQVLQRVMQSSTSDKVRAGALELLQALTDTGLIGPAGRGGRQAQAAQAEAV